MEFQPLDPDLPLIRAMASGDEKALDQLYERYGQRILGFLMARLNHRELAEEVLQDVMLAVWKAAPTFRSASMVRTWLLTIARNQAINALRRRQLMTASLNEEIDIQSDETEPLERIMRENRNADLRRTLDSLPEMHREVLTLVFFHQLSGPEVAEVLDIPVGTVKSRLNRAKAALRYAMQGEGEP